MKNLFVASILFIGFSHIIEAQVTVTRDKADGSSVTTTTTKDQGRKTIPQVSDRTFSINNAYDDLLWNINRAKRDAAKRVGANYFSQYPIRKDKSGFADETGVDAGLFTGHEAESMSAKFIVDGTAYRLPTAEEMAALVPLTGTEPPVIRFGENIDIQQRTEKVSLSGGEPITTRADYYASAKDDNHAVVAIRFQDATNKHRTAFRYEISGNSLLVRTKVLGQDLSVMSPQDITSSGWWMRQADTETRRFPLNVVGHEKKKTLLSAIYWTGTSQGAQHTALCITNEAVRLTAIPQSEQGYAVPVYDLSAACGEGADFFGCNAYGNNLSLDQDPATGNTDSCRLVVESYDLPERGLTTTLKIYARSMNGTPTMRLRGRKDGSFVSVADYRKEYPTFRNYKESEPAEGAKLFEIEFTNNYSDFERYAEIEISDGSGRDGHSKIYYVRQRSVGLPMFESEQVPAEFFADDCLTPEGKVAGDDDENYGFFTAEEAKTRACVAIKTDPADSTSYVFYHLPTLREMQCILPSVEMKFNGSGERISVHEDFSFAGYNSSGWDSYYQHKNGRIYAQRFGTNKDRFCNAARYEWVSDGEDSGLRVTVVYNNMEGKIFYQEMTNDELFDGDSPTYMVFFPATGNPDGTGRGEVGWIWTASEGSLDAVAYTFDRDHIAPVKLPLTQRCAIMPFEGKVDFAYVTEEMERQRELEALRKQQAEEDAKSKTALAVTEGPVQVKQHVAQVRTKKKAKREKGNRQADVKKKTTSIKKPDKKPTRPILPTF